MTDRSVFLFINGLAGKVPFFDGLFKGISNDYFGIISCCLVLIFIWFGTRDPSRRRLKQRMVITTAISIGLASFFVFISNQLYFRPRPFVSLPPGSVHLLFYRPTDSSFPANIAAVLFSITIPVLVKDRLFGSILLAIAVLVCFGRIYIGVHYPLDILGGAALGALAALLAWGVSRLIAPVEDLVLNFLQRIYLA